MPVCIFQGGLGFTHAAPGSIAQKQANDAMVKGIVQQEAQIRADAAKLALSPSCHRWRRIRLTTRCDYAGEWPPEWRIPLSDQHLLALGE